MVRDLLYSIGFGFIWENQHVETEKIFFSSITQRVKDIYLQEWQEHVNRTSANRLYKHIKREFGFEGYLKTITNEGLRLAVTRICLGSHNFMVERGRWGVPRLDITERVCPECNKIEDEFHCFLECPRFQDLSVKYLPHHVRNKPSMYKFTHMFMDEGRIHNLANFCFLLLKKYKSLM